MRGKLITFEGPEGSGKSTQSKLLCEYLKEKGTPLLYTRDPGDTEAGEKIREVLLDPKLKGISPETECLLYLAARAQLVEEKIKPALEQDKIVMVDRFTDSTTAYQVSASGVSPELVQAVNVSIIGDIKPDLTIYLDIKAEEGLKRSRGAHAQDRMEAKGIDYHKKVREAYLKLAKAEPERIKVIPVKDDINETQDLIRKEVDKIL